MLEIAIIVVIVGGGWLMWDSLKAREAANAAIRPACRAAGFLFLDDTVALERMRPARDEDDDCDFQHRVRNRYRPTICARTSPLG